MKKTLLTLLALAMLLHTSCITEDVATPTRAGNFMTLWKIIDEHYCFFDYKQQAYGLDWDEVRQRYEPAISEGMTNVQLFEVLSDMTAELRDGHVNLTAAHNVARYGEWFDNYPMNFSDSLERKYLGRASEYRAASGLRYRILSDNVGYLRVPSFDVEFGDGNLQEMVRYLGGCNALIVDVRNNGGGMLSSAEKLTTIFVNQTTTVGYIQHKTGPGHNDFSAPRKIEVTPFDGLRWQKPVFVLTNRRTYSAANSFVMYMSQLPAVTIVGDRTGGGAGMPFSSELPNGWGIRFSACPMLNAKGEHTEFGIEPHVHVDISSHDYSRSIDTIIETARNMAHDN